MRDWKITHFTHGTEDNVSKVLVGTVFNCAYAVRLETAPTESGYCIRRGEVASPDGLGNPNPTGVYCCRERRSAFPTKYGVTTLLVDAVSNCAVQTRFEVLSS